MLCVCVYVIPCPVSIQLFILPPDAAGEHAALHRQRSLPHRPPVIPLVARMADQNTSGTPAMTEREASRLDKFKQLLAGPNTDLGKRSKTLLLSVSMCYTVHLSNFCSVSLYISTVFAFSLFLFSKLFNFFISFALFCYSLLVCSLSVCQLCCAFNDAVRGKVIQPSGHADYKGKKYHQQQKQMTGLCSNQPTGLYCLSNPRDFAC